MPACIDAKVASTEPPRDPQGLNVEGQCGVQKGSPADLAARVESQRSSSAGMLIAPGRVGSFYCR
jgi:hypothetical protein